MILDVEMQSQEKLLKLLTFISLPELKGDCLKKLIKLIDPPNMRLLIRCMSMINFGLVNTDYKRKECEFNNSMGNIPLVAVKVLKIPEIVEMVCNKYPYKYYYTKHNIEDSPNSKSILSAISSDISAGVLTTDNISSSFIRIIDVQEFIESEYCFINQILQAIRLKEVLTNPTLLGYVGQLIEHLMDKNPSLVLERLLSLKLSDIISDNLGKIPIFNIAIQMMSIKQTDEKIEAYTLRDIQTNFTQHIFKLFTTPTHPDNLLHFTNFLIKVTELSLDIVPYKHMYDYLLTTKGNDEVRIHCIQIISECIMQSKIKNVSLAFDINLLKNIDSLLMPINTLQSNLLLYNIYNALLSVSTPFDDPKLDISIMDSISKHSIKILSSPEFHNNSILLTQLLKFYQLSSKIALLIPLVFIPNLITVVESANKLHVHCPLYPILIEISLILKELKSQNYLNMSLSKEIKNLYKTHAKQTFASGSYKYDATRIINISKADALLAFYNTFQSSLLDDITLDDGIDDLSINKV